MEALVPRCSGRVALLLGFLGLVVAAGCKGEPESQPAPHAPNQTPAPSQSAADPQRDAAPDLQVREFASVSEVVAHIMTMKPRVLGIGEFHQKAGSAPVRSTLERFTETLASLAGGASDLVLETWVEGGQCGEVEKTVSEDVRKTTQRPPVVENHLLRLLREAKEHGMRRHVLSMRCEDYAAVKSDDGEVDYDKMLELIKIKLAAAIARAHGLEAKKAAAGQTGTIVVYGGAFHNDLYPYKSTQHYSYAAAAEKLVGDGYIELDLYVPEYVAGNELLQREAWYPLLERRGSPEGVVLIERGPRSYIVILRTRDTARANPAGKAPPKMRSK